MLAVDRFSVAVEQPELQWMRALFDGSAERRALVLFHQGLNGALKLLLRCVTAGGNLHLLPANPSRSVATCSLEYRLQRRHRRPRHRHRLSSLLSHLLSLVSRLSSGLSLLSLLSRLSALLSRLSARLGRLPSQIFSLVSINLLVFTFVAAS